MIFFQPSLNGLPFIFSPPLLHKSPLSFIPKGKKPPISSPLLSSNEVEWSYHILVFLRLKVLNETHSSSPNSSFPPPLEPPSRVSSSTIWILHESIIPFRSEERRVGKEIIFSCKIYMVEKETLELRVEEKKS